MKKCCILLLWRPGLADFRAPPLGSNWWTGRAHPVTALGSAGPDHSGATR